MRKYRKEHPEKARESVRKYNEKLKKLKVKKLKENKKSLQTDSNSIV